MSSDCFQINDLANRLCTLRNLPSAITYNLGLDSIAVCACLMFRWCKQQPRNFDEPVAKEYFYNVAFNS